MAGSSPMPVKTVLVADDTEFVRERFRLALDSAGHRTVSARTGPELLARLRRAEPAIDLVLLDLRLPEGRGVELLRTIRAEHPNHPVLVFSGTIADAREVQAIGGLGVSGYINEYTGPQHIVPALAPHLFADGENRRSSPRAALGVAVAYRVGNTISTGLSLNISTGGLAVRTTSPLEVGTAAKLRFRLPKVAHDIEADARVAWSNARVGMGLQFTRIDKGDQAAVESYVTAHFFSNRKA
jgi:uncharacterized protein (TIGR02266 family)